jgi:hypothetical protein
MKQIYHPYTKWEDYHDGMWRKVSKKEEERFLQIAIEFTGNHEIYGHWMIEVAKNWTFACEHNLTDIDQNRKAWIGHAAASMGKKIPEYITRMAWGFLTKEQQDSANDMADKAIEFWEKMKGIKRDLYVKELFE